MALTQTPFSTLTSVPVRLTHSFRFFAVAGDEGTGMKVAACRISEVTSPYQTLGAASLTCVAARPLVCHKHVCKGPFLASPKIKIFCRTTRTTRFGEQPPPSAQPVAQISAWKIPVSDGRRNSGPGGADNGFPWPPLRSRLHRLRGVAGHGEQVTKMNSDHCQAAKQWNHQPRLEAAKVRG